MILVSKEYNHSLYVDEGPRTRTLSGRGDKHICIANREWLWSFNRVDQLEKALQAYPASLQVVDFVELFMNLGLDK